MRAESSKKMTSFLQRILGGKKPAHQALSLTGTPAIQTKSAEAPEEESRHHAQTSEAESKLNSLFAFVDPKDPFAPGELAEEQFPGPILSILSAKKFDRIFLFYTPHTRKIVLRSAMVMSAERGGTFDILLRLVRFGLGGTSGSGKQFVSWIHQSDFVRALDCLMAHEEFEGPINVASPNPLPNEAFMRILRKAWGARVGLPASKWMLEVGAFFLRSETELILKSRRVVPGLLLASGFEFQFSKWRGAAEDLVQRWRGQN